MRICRREASSRKLKCTPLLQGGVSGEEASREEQARVAGIVAEADHPQYWVLASRDGNRVAHYTGRLSTQAAWTLAACAVPCSATCGAGGHAR